MKHYNKTINFFERLRENNSKEWMDANREEYKEIRADFEDFAGKLIDEISRLDPGLGSVEVKLCTYRQNKNLRFAKDKRPYKTHFGLFIAPGGRKSGYCGYYIHLEPEGGKQDNYLSFGGSFIGVGTYAPHPTVLKSIREEILYNGTRIQEIIQEAKNVGFILNSESLKRNPSGFPQNGPFDDLLRLKNISLSKKLSPKIFDCKNPAKELALEFCSTVPLVSIINKAIRYAFEEMM